MVSLAAIFVTGAVQFGKTDLTPFVMSSLTFEGEPWRLVASALPHAGLIHLLFNVYWLWILGTRVEEELGHVAMIVLVSVLAVASSAAQFAFSVGGIGLSGVGYGIVGFLAAARRIDPRFRDAIDTRTLQLFVAWFFLCIVLTITNVMPIGNYAHGAGFLLGIPLAYAMLPTGLARRIGAGLLALVLTAGFLGGAGLWRTKLNLSSHAGDDDVLIGLKEIEEKKYEAAVRHLESAVKLSPNDANAWYNYGVALQYGSGHLDMDDLDAWKKALALDPKDENARNAVADTLRRQADMLAKDNRLAEAEKLYRESLAVKEAPTALWNYGVLLDELDRHPEAAKMYERAQQLDPSRRKDASPTDSKSLPGPESPTGSAATGSAQ